MPKMFCGHAGNEIFYVFNLSTIKIIHFNVAGASVFERLWLFLLRFLIIRPVERRAGSGATLLYNIVAKGNSFAKWFEHKMMVEQQKGQFLEIIVVFYDNLSANMIDGAMPLVECLITALTLTT